MRTATKVKSFVDFATQEDTPAIQALLRGRPAENVDTFVPPQQGWYMVVRDDAGISAFMVVRWDEAHGALVADQLEIEYRDGRPTMRGRRALKLLGDELHRRADEVQARVYSPVVLANRRHIEVLKRNGYSGSVLLMVRQPKPLPED